ncbi:exported protein of unknown function [Modestobacter italicus]|uniref:Uncharacterized protein n=1 Tax=Modestobacter italicus (strain DSM 44449 / CECT 9708 / BC 501) TaxID=2732864 RepID=I4EWP6_MODI5|nr:exported protein of unknown function [Modestobacter marinus]
MRPGLKFARRSRRDQRGLSLAWLTCVLALGVVGWLRIGASQTPEWLVVMWPLCWVAVFSLYVLLVRRDEPPDGW